MQDKQIDLFRCMNPDDREFFTQFDSLRRKDTKIYLDPQLVSAQLAEYTTRTDELLIESGEEPFWSAAVPQRLLSRLTDQIEAGLTKVGGMASISDMVNWTRQLVTGLAEEGNLEEEQTAWDINMYHIFGLNLALLGASDLTQTGKVEDKVQTKAIFCSALLASAPYGPTGEIGIGPNPNSWYNPS